MTRPRTPAPGPRARGEKLERQKPELRRTMHIDTKDANRGLYQKYRVQRVDGEHLLGGKHAACQHFVLDATHDPFAKPALLAYADACEADYPLLANDLRALANR